MSRDRETKPLRLAAPAPERRPRDEDAPALNEEQRDLDILCERWVRWKASRRLFGPPPTMGSVIGQLGNVRTRPLKQDGPNAVCSAEMAALHVAYTCQPDALDKRVFDLYYVHRVAPIKSAAAALKISRKHFYTVLGDFRKRLYTGMRAIMQEEQGKLAEIEREREARSALGK